MEEEVWTVKRILDWIEGYLGNHGDANPRLSAQWLVSEALGVQRIQLYLDLNRLLTDEERALLRDYTRRRGAGEPLQYITGEAPFRHITLKVAPGVLIPRPETEVLVSEALALLPLQEKPQDFFDAEIIRYYKELTEEDELKEEKEEAGNNTQIKDETFKSDCRPLIADICTGSGCIACSIANEYPLARIIATDIDPKAIALAQENVDNLGLEESVEILQSDLGKEIDPSLLGTFDLVVSNPPYIPSNVLANIPHEVTAYEPAIALDGGEDGLDIFRLLLKFCKEALKPGGAFVFELHETTLEKAANEARAAGFSEVSVVYDLAEKPRILLGKSF